MKYLESFSDSKNSDILFIVDVQKSFSEYFTEMYVNELKNLSKEFNEVYQIWDNHFLGKNVKKSYLYRDNPLTPVTDEFYKFGEKSLIEKRYNYDVDVNFYKSILDKQTYSEMKRKESNNLFKEGDKFKTTKGTYLIKINNNHIWFEVPKKMVNLFKKLKGKEVIVTGGGDSECLQDIFVAAESFGLKPKRRWRYIYTASHSPS